MQERLNHTIRSLKISQITSKRPLESPVCKPKALLNEIPPIQLGEQIPLQVSKERFQNYLGFYEEQRWAQCQSFSLYGLGGDWEFDFLPRSQMMPLQTEETPIKISTIIKPVSIFSWRTLPGDTFLHSLSHLLLLRSSLSLSANRNFALYAGPKPSCQPKHPHALFSFSFNTVLSGGPASQSSTFCAQLPSSGNKGNEPVFGEFESLKLLVSPWLCIMLSPLISIIYLCFLSLT